MNDDTKLKIVFYTILVLSMVAIIGLWEQIIQPIALFLIKNISINV